MEPKKRKRISLSLSEFEGRKPPKRHRRSTSPTVTSPNHGQFSVPLSDLIRHQKLWFPDGDIVLAAGNRCFKVQRSQLSRSCTVFEDMLGAPSGGPDEELMEGLVLVRMPDDATDLTNFLSALYNGSSFNFDTMRADNFPAICGVMRMATKYDCNILRARILEQLRARYPSPSCPGVTHGFRLFKFSTPHTSVIPLARSCDIPEILPSCFYQLAFCTDGRFSDIDSLAPTDKKRLEDGKCAVLKRVSELLCKGPPDIKCPWCPSPPRDQRSLKNSKHPKCRCSPLLKKHWAESFVSGGRLQTLIMRDPLRELSRLSDRKTRMVKSPNALEEGPPFMCAECQSKFMAHMREVTRNIVSNVHTDFNL